jgi:Fe-S cluster assembly scaffold protein SufB
MTTAPMSYTFSRATVEALSRDKNEPSWMTELRLSAWEAYERSPLAESAIGFSLDRIQPYIPVPHDPVPSHQWPAELQHALDERGDEEGLIVQRDSTIQSHSISKEYSKKGVLFTDLDRAIKIEPELVQQYFGKLINQANPHAALSTALWSGGTILYVPTHIAVHLPFHTCLWMSRPRVGIFHRTLIIVEEGAVATFIDEGVSADWSEPGLAIGSVEAFVGIRGCVNYYQLQNWGRSVTYHLEEQSEVGPQGRFLSGRMMQRSATTLEKVAELHPEVRV